MKKVIFNEPKEETVSIKNVNCFGFYGGDYGDDDRKVVLCKCSDGKYIVILTQYINQYEYGRLEDQKFDTPKECMKSYHDRFGVKFYQFGNAKDLLRWALDLK